MRIRACLKILCRVSIYLFLGCCFFSTFLHRFGVCSINYLTVLGWSCAGTAQKHFNASGSQMFLRCFSFSDWFLKLFLNVFASLWENFRRFLGGFGMNLQLWNNSGQCQRFVWTSDQHIIMHHSMMVMVVMTVMVLMMMIMMMMMMMINPREQMLTYSLRQHGYSATVDHLCRFHQKPDGH